MAYHPSVHPTLKARKSNSYPATPLQHPHQKSHLTNKSQGGSTPPPIDWHLIAKRFKAIAQYQCHDKRPGFSKQDARYLEKKNPKLFAEMFQAYERLKETIPFRKTSPAGFSRHEKFFAYFKSIGKFNFNRAVSTALTQVAISKDLPLDYDGMTTPTSFILTFPKRFNSQQQANLKNGLFEYFAKKGIRIPNLRFVEVPNAGPKGSTNHDHSYELVFIENTCSANSKAAKDVPQT